MSDKNLNRVVKGIFDFGRALNARVDQDEWIRGKIQQSMQFGELEILQEKTQSYQVQMLGCIFNDSEPDENLQKLTVELVDMSTDIIMRVLTKEDLAACMPVDLKNQADADLLRDLGANNLADLCVFDLGAQPAAPVKNTPPKTFHKYKF